MLGGGDREETMGLTGTWWGDRAMVADTMVVSLRVVGLLQTPWISY